MPEMSFEQAAEALAAANRGETPTPPEQAETPTPKPEVDTGAAPDAVDSFTTIDPALLPPELQAAYKHMQGDYTRKTQEVAETRKRYEQLGDPDEAAQAVQFVAALQSDPQFALEVHGQLSEALQAAGLSPAQASQEAARQIEEAAGGTPDTDDDLSYGDDDPRLKQALDDLNQLKSWKAEMEASRQEIEIAAELQRQTMAIRQENPTYTDADLDAIARFAWSTEGNLIEAQKIYEGERQRMLQAYLDSKAQVPAAPPPGSGYSEVPRKFSSLDEAAVAAEEHLRRVLNEN